MPCRGILCPSISPLVKIGRKLSNSLIFLASMPWITPRLAASLACQPSRSAMSTLLGCVMKRLIAADVSRFCIVTLKPRSLAAWSPIAFTTEYDTPTWRNSMSLISCAQIVGKPVMASVPTAAPATAAPAFRNDRRSMPLVDLAVLLPVVLPVLPLSFAVMCSPLCQFLTLQIPVSNPPDGTPVFELSEQIEECRHDDAPSRHARA